jgi:GntR family transcriptional regulator
MGLKTHVELIDFGYVAAPSEVATLLELEVDALVQKAVRVRSFDGTPFSFLTTHIPEAIGRSFAAEDLREKPLLALLERAGAEVSQADQTITAKLADTRVAPLLQVELGAALLCVKRLVRDQNDRPVELLEALYRPDIYEYQMIMSRAKQGATSVWSATTR